MLITCNESMTNINVADNENYSIDIYNDYDDEPYIITYSNGNISKVIVKYTNKDLAIEGFNLIRKGIISNTNLVEIPFSDYVIPKEEDDSKQIGFKMG